MYKNVLASIPGIEWYPVVALLFFFSFFGVLVIWYFRADQRRLEALAASILNDGTPRSESNSPSKTMQGS
ncbi:MAG: hypothetical protein IPI29_08165 [Ignavibacteria bacterium]|jgi:hypothetical protein|nr:hypothetical protein [Ignavibacteria bacterium]